MIAVALAYLVAAAQSQFRSRRWVDSQRGRVVLTPKYRAEGGWYVTNGSWPLPQLLVDTMGIDFFVSAKIVVLDCEEIHDLSGIIGLTRLEELHINQFVHDIRAFNALRDLHQLKRVTLSKWSGLTRDQIALISNSLCDVEIIKEEWLDCLLQKSDE